MEIVRNRLNVKEQNSGKLYTFYFRTPELEETLDHLSRYRKAFKLEEEASIREISATKLDGVELILTGVGENQFEVEIDGEETFLSPQVEDWKGILRRRYYYLLYVVFDEAFTRRGMIEAEKKS